MNFDRAKQFIELEWDARVSEPLAAYIAMPCLSPAFDPAWEASGHLGHAAIHLADWARAATSVITGASVEVLRSPGRTPAILLDIPGHDEAPPVILYGHFDKQPPMGAWREGLDPWTPVVEGDRLYGRGSADDGYAIFSAVLSLLALREQGLAHPRCLVLIEGSEESGSGDLPDYVEQMARRLDAAPGLIAALDAGAGDYDRLWITTSVRGQVAGVLRIETLNEAVHSGEACGVAPSSLRIAMQLLSRLEDPVSGEINGAFCAPIPVAGREQAEAAAQYVDLAAAMPLSGATRAVAADSVELLLNRAWRPQLAVTGLDGLPTVEGASAVMQPTIALKLGLRLPPTVDAVSSARRLEELLEADPPYDCTVTFEVTMVSQGWDAPPMAPWLEACVEEGSTAGFGAPGVLFGGGGGIPFLAALADRFPQTQFLVTGVLGPELNAHGPNEFLHLPTVKRLTAALALVLNRALDLRGGDQP